jgi:hypothetical protein
MVDLVVDRPDGYWLKLNRNKNNNNEYIDIITQFLNGDVNLYTQLVTRWVSQAEMTKTIPKSTYDPKIHWFLSDGDEDEDGDTYIVVDQKDAQAFPYDWELYGMGLYPDGTKIKVNSFEDLITVMTKLNPYWILEWCYIVLPGRDFSRIEPNPNYKYVATVEEVAAIRQKLLDIVT